MLSSQRLCPSSCRSFVAFIPHLGFVTIQEPRERNVTKGEFRCQLSQATVGIIVISSKFPYSHTRLHPFQPRPARSRSRIRCPRIFLSTQPLTNEKSSPESPYGNVVQPTAKASD